MSQFEQSTRDGAVWYALSGRLDSAAVERMELPFTASMRSGAGGVAIDLQAVPFIGSLAIRMLISAHRVLQRAGRTMVLVGAQPQVLDVFETVALGDLIPLAANHEEAKLKLAG